MEPLFDEQKGHTEPFEKAARTLRIIIPVLAVVTLVFGTFGYMRADGDISFWRALHATVALLLMETTEDAGTANALIWIAKYAALGAVTATVLSVVLILAWWRIRTWIMSWREDFTVIYTDTAWGRRLEQTMPHHACTARCDADEDNIIPAKHSIIMYADDMKALNFYSRNRARFRNRNVYMALARVDSFLLEKTPDAEHVALHYFNVLDLAARNYWRKHSLYDLLGTPRKPEPVHIAIIGYGAEGKAIFKYGYLNNLYSLNQEIHYHIWGCAGAEKSFLNGLNQDAKRMLDYIHAHDGDWRETAETLRTMDRIIIALENPIDAIQELLHINPRCEIHCYSGEDTDFATIFKSGKIRTFGVNDVLNGEAIKAEEMYRMAKLINFDYWLHHTDEGKAFYPWNMNKYPPELDAGEEAKMEELWQSADGFDRGSNIAAADHYSIKKLLKEKYGEYNREICELEHIRWCRYHFYNCWEWYEGEGATKKNKELKLHRCLCPFDKLDPEDQKKDEVSDRFKGMLDKLS